MNPWALIGRGPNELEIVGLIFKDKSSALRWCKDNIHAQPGLSLKDKFWWHWEDLDSDLLSEIFTHYYGGCGECWQLYLREVEPATPFVAFDLD